jgi:hypothetical protein
MPYPAVRVPREGVILFIWCSQFEVTVKVCTSKEPLQKGKAEYN